MSDVDLTVEFDATPEQLFQVLLDIKRTPEWVTICRKVISVDPGKPKVGWRCQQLYALRGAPFPVSWEVTAQRACAMSTTSLPPAGCSDALLRAHWSAAPQSTRRKSHWIA